MKNKPPKINKGWDRVEFDKALIKNDDLKLTECCNRRWYRTKKNLKCSGCKKVVTENIMSRGIMQSIDKMMKAKENEKDKNNSDSKTSDDKG